MAPPVDFNIILIDADLLISQWRDLFIGTEDIERLRDEATKNENHVYAATCNIALAEIQTILKG